MIVAGLDVGNTTTEVVVAELGARGARALGVAHARTSGRKGSVESLRGARRLLEEIERDVRRQCDLVAVCELHPVDTMTVPIVESAEQVTLVRDLGGAASQTPAGVGLADGPHRALENLAEAPPDSEPVVVSVPAAIDFEDAAARLNEAAVRGWQIAGVIAGGDDAVLIHNRLDFDVPIVDQVPLEALTDGVAVALEVGRDGNPISSLSDPAVLARRLNLTSTRLADLAASARQLLGRRAAAVTAAAEADPSPQPATGHLEMATDEGVFELALDTLLPEKLSTLAPASARALVLNLGRGRQRRLEVRDAWAADLRSADHAGWLRRGLADLDRAPLATLADLPAPGSGLIQDELERRTWVAGLEADSAARGARTTPGAPSEAVVLDIGGGTIDLIAPEATVSVAGGGDLLTAAIGIALGLPNRLAERVKRGPAVQIATPHLAHREDGSRHFLAPPAPGTAVGHLALVDEGNVTPFVSGLAAEEWRGLRHALKEQVVASNVKRCLNAIGQTDGTLLVAGGGALDHEVVAMIGEHLRGEWVVARADVAGQFGSRFAVGWGAVLAAGREENRAAA